MDEVGFRHLKVVVRLGNCLVAEDATEQVKVLSEETGGRELIHACQNDVMLYLLLDIQFDIGEHGLEGVFETIWRSLPIAVVFLVVRDSEKCFQELGVVEIVVHIQGVLERNLYKVNLCHAFDGVHRFIGRPCEIHHPHPVKERLPDDIKILLLLEPLLVESGIKLEVVHQFLMVNGQNRHGRIKVFLMLVESEVHRFEVDLQLLRVLLLLGDLLLLLVSKPGLLLFESLLGHSGLGLSALVLFFLLCVELSQFGE